MRLKYSRHCDVLVVGSGIAGIMAALAAAVAGRSVILASSGPVFSGSSFYPGTWGLGLIGPENEADQEDLVQSILEVGCGMADEAMVRAFVAGIAPAIEGVKAMGVQLKAAARPRIKRILFPVLTASTTAGTVCCSTVCARCSPAKWRNPGVDQLPGCELLQLIKTDGPGERCSGLLRQRADRHPVRCAGAGHRRLWRPVPGSPHHR